MLNPVLFGTLSRVHLPHILRYEAILNCLDKEKGHKTEEGAKFKHWAKNNFRKTTESLTGM
jgi:hypothetical protein